MASAGAIRAGEAYVEITANTAALKAGLAKAQKSLKSFGDSLSNIGTKLFAAGAAGAGVFGGSLAVFSGLEDKLADLRASTNPTAETFSKIQNAVNSISIATGKGPAEIAGAFTELSKAGVDVQTILGGAAKSAVEFAKVGGIGVSEAAITMADALNVFSKEGLKSADVVNILSSAADASSIGIEQITQAFAQSSAVFGLAGAKMKDLAVAIAVLGKAGIKGSDAGTSLKTFLLKLQAPTTDAAKTIEEFGLNFRDAAGNMLPVRDIIQELQKKLGGLNAEAKDRALSNLFGSDAIRAAGALLNAGAAGFDDFSKSMSEANTVAKKFEILSGTLSGRLEALWAAVQRVGVAIGTAINEPVKQAIDAGVKYLNIIAQIIQRNQELVPVIAGVVLGVAGAGVAMILLSKAIIALSAFLSVMAAAWSAASVAAGIFGAVISAIGAPVLILGAVIAASAALIIEKSSGVAKSLQYLGGEFGVLKKAALSAFGGIADALKAGDLKLAGEIALAGLNVGVETGLLALQKIWLGFKSWFADLIDDIFYGAVITVSDAMYDLSIAVADGLKKIQDSPVLKLLFPTLSLAGDILGGDAPATLRQEKKDTRAALGAEADARQAERNAGNLLDLRPQQDALGKSVVALNELTEAARMARRIQDLPREFFGGVVAAIEGGAPGSTGAKAAETKSKIEAGAKDIFKTQLSGGFGGARFDAIGTSSVMEKVAKASDRTAKATEATAKNTSFLEAE